MNKISIIWFLEGWQRKYSNRRKLLQKIKALPQTNGCWFSDNNAFHQIIKVYLCFSGKLSDKIFHNNSTLISLKIFNLPKPLSGSAFSSIQ